MSATPVLVAYHVRSGIAALNVISAALGVDGRTVKVGVRFAKSRDDLAREISAARDDGRSPVAAWSFYSTDFARASEDLAWVRERVGDAALHVAGGVHATAEPEETLRAGFDLAVVGEGESTAVELFAALLRGEDPRALRGTAHLDAAGRFVTRGPGERRPLDDFPGMNLLLGKWNALEITRGCVYACSFCQTPFMFKARFRHRSVANVRAHVDEMTRDHGVRFMRFVTPTALSYGADGETPNLDAVEALLASVREGIGPDKRLYFGTFPSEVRPEHVTVEALELLARYVDNDTLVIGAQSGSDDVLRAMRRGHDVGDVIRAVELSVAHGFRPDVDFLWGLPGESADDRLASVRLAERLVAMGARIHAHAFMPLPGTPLGRRAPEAIEAPVADRMSRLESRGAMHGQWRAQVVAAEALVRRRRA